MSASRLHMVTLGVADLPRATAFYEKVFGQAPIADYEGVRFFALRGTWISLFPMRDLIKDIGSSAPPAQNPGQFSGITLAHNTRSEDEVRAVFELASEAGATILKPPAATFWGGFAGYFSDLDGYVWEIAYGSMFDFDDDGTMKFRQK